jgi:hypothetical protein
MRTHRRPNANPSNIRILREQAAVVLVTVHLLLVSWVEKPGEEASVGESREKPGVGDEERQLGRSCVSQLLFNCRVLSFLE